MGVGVGPDEVLRRKNREMSAAITPTTAAMVMLESAERSRWRFLRPLKRRLSVKLPKTMK